MHILNFTLVYPLGQQPDDVELPPEGVQTVGPFEIYEFQTADCVSAIGEVKEFPLDGRWIVAEIESYQPQQSSALAGFHIVVCSRDGQPPKRYESQTKDFRALCLTMQGNEIVEREPGLADWWSGSEFCIPRPSEDQDVLLFEPHEQSDFDVIAVRQMRAAIAA